MPRRKREIELVLDLPEDVYFEYSSDVKVDMVGMKLINLTVMQDTKNRDLPYDFNNEFQNKQGRLSKRVSKYIYDTYGIKLSGKALEKVGNIANKYTVRQNVMYGFTRDFNWSRGDFGDDYSCFWGDRSQAKNMIWENGAYALRLFNFKGNDPKEITNVLPFGIGRAWVMPARLPDSQGNMEHYPVVFNAYRKRGYPFEMRDFAMIMADFMTKSKETEYTVKPIKLLNNRDTEGILYLNREVYQDGRIQDGPGLANSSFAFLVAPPKVCKNVDRYDFEIDEEEYRRREEEEEFMCELCEEYQDMTVWDDATERYENNNFYVRHLEDHNIGGTVCGRCYRDHILECPRCRQHFTFHRDLGADVLTNENNRRVWCPTCVDQHSVICDQCGDYFSTARRSSDNQTLPFLFDEDAGNYFCPTCAEDRQACQHCNRVELRENLEEIDGRMVCDVCYPELYDTDPELRFPDYRPFNASLMRDPMEPDNTDYSFGADEVSPEPIPPMIPMADPNEFLQRLALSMDQFNTNIGVLRTRAEHFQDIAEYHWNQWRTFSDINTSGED